MALDSGGRVLLKIYSAQCDLLVAKPFPSLSAATEWYDEVRVRKEPGETYEITEMVPRI